jgi:hypothetical protein
MVCLVWAWVCVCGWALLRAVARGVTGGALVGTAGGVAGVAVVGTHRLRRVVITDRQRMHLFVEWCLVVGTSAAQNKKL